MKARAYRAIFRRPCGRLLGLDFEAINVGLARDHANHVAFQGYGLFDLTVVSVKRVSDEPLNSGTFYPVSPEELR